MAVIAPEAPKAATMGGPDLVRFSFPIEKSKDTATINPVDGTPDIEIWGKVTDGTLDSDLQIVDPDWSLAALRKWFDTKANIRMGHDPKRPVGRGLEIDGHYVKALIAEPVAKHLIRQKVLNDWSVGIMNPDVRKNDPRFRHLDPQGKAIHGVITGRPDGLSEIGEISTVDRGSNYGTAFQLVKAAADGGVQWTGTLTAPDDVLAKYAAPGLTKSARDGSVSIDLPKNMGLRITPKNLARLQTLTQRLALEEAALKAAAPAVTKAAAEPGPEAGPQYHAMKAAEAAVYKRDIDTATRRRLASEGKALPDGSYPIETAGDLENAAILQRSGHGDVKAAARLIARRAKDLGVPSPLKKKPKASPAMKTAEPDVAKCKCTAGMMDGVPCTDCKPGRRMAKRMAKTAAPGAAKKKGKLRAVCPNCGARQNPEHMHCPECGHQLPPQPPMVAKNHDFMCLGCGKELDKGEKFCPGCGKENPGHNPMADLKIPANADADKSAGGKDRVAKAKKKSGKKDKMPFGGSQAKPFGSEDDKPDDKAKTARPKAEKRKGKGKGRRPDAGVVGRGDSMGLPGHREPDGMPVEMLEHDAAMEDGDEGEEMRAAMRHKALGVEPHLAVLHDLTCPAFSPAAVSRAIPHASFGGIDTGWWSGQALKAASGGDTSSMLARYNELANLSRMAVTLKTADPEALHRVRLAHHAAFLETNGIGKAFRDATPGPGTAPTPGHVMPQSFRRPYISGGHAAASPQAMPARTFPVISDHPEAQDFQRGYLQGGHAAQSPDNSGPRPEPMPGGSAGSPMSVAGEAGRMQERDYASATMAMHDHLSRIAPGMCPMSPPVGEGQKPGRPVPGAVGMPVPHKAKASKAERAADKAERRAKVARKAATAAARKAKAEKRKLRRQALKAATATPAVLPAPAEPPPRRRSTPRQSPRPSRPPPRPSSSASSARTRRCGRTRRCSTPSRASPTRRQPRSADRASASRLPRRRRRRGRRPRQRSWLRPPTSSDCRSSGGIATTLQSAKPPGRSSRPS